MYKKLLVLVGLVALLLGTPAMAWGFSDFLSEPVVGRDTPPPPPPPQPQGKSVWCGGGNC